MSRPLEGKVVLVTGGSGGIGKAASIKFAEHGCAAVAVHYNSGADRAEEVVTEIKTKYTTQVKIYQADLNDYESVRRMHTQIVSDFGDIDILYNNAGTNLKPLGAEGTIEELDITTFETTWRVNTGSAFLLTQLCLPSMVKKQWGRIIFCSSIAAFTGGMVGPHYASSKSALHGMLHWLSQRYAKQGITVNAVAPALIKDTIMLPGNDALKARIPVGRLGTPEEVAEVVLLMSTNGYISNKVWGIDGGMYPY